MSAGYRNAPFACIVGSLLLGASAAVLPAASGAPSQLPPLPTPEEMKRAAEPHRGGHACKPGAPLEVRLDFAAEPKVGEPAQLVLSVVPGMPLQNPEVRWSLPEGVRGLAAPERPAGPLAADQLVRFTASVAFTRPGEYQFSALVLEKGAAAQWGRQARLWVRLDASGRAQVSRTPFAPPAATRTGAAAAPAVAAADAYARAGSTPASKAVPGPVRVSPSYSDTPPNSQYARVRGYIRYRHNDGNMRGLMNATVEVWDTDGWTGGSHDRLATLTTSNEGYFHSEWFFNRDEEWSGNRQDIQMVIIAENEFVRVINPQHQGPYKVLYNGPRDLPDGDNFFGNIEMDWDGPGEYPDDGIEAAYEIFDTLSYAGRWNRAAGRQIPRVDAWYQVGGSTRAQYDGGNWRMYLADGDQFDPHVILHEYGHHVMDFYRGGLPASSDEYYPWYLKVNPAWAWSEGWATYMACIMARDPWYRDRPGVGDGSSLYESIEHHEGNLPEGDSYGSAVAGALWDLVDELPDDPNPRDQFAYGENEIFLNMTQMAANTSIWEFRAAWHARNRGYGIEGIFQDHNILPNSPVNVIVDAPNRTGKPGQTVVFNTTLRRATDNTPIRWQTLTFSYGGQVFATVTTDTNGQCAPEFTIPANAWDGTNPVYVEFGGNWKYNAATGICYLTVARDASTITTQAVTGKTGETVQLSATLKRSADGAALAGRSVYFHVAGTPVGSATTDAEGVARLSFQISAGVGVGQKTLHASFYGDSQQAAAYAQSTLTIQDITRVAVVNATVAIGQNATFRARLTRASDGLGVAGKTLYFRIDERQVGSAETNANGTAELRYRVPESLAPGTYELGAASEEDAEYAAGAGRGTLTVNLGTTSLTAPAVKGAVGQAVYLVGTLRRPADAVALAGRTLAFSVNDQPVGTATTDAAGTARLRYVIPESLGVGSRTIRVAYEGDAVNRAAQRAATLTVSKANTTTLSLARTGRVNAPVTLTATLRRATDTAPLAGKTVTFKVSGVVVGTAVTNEKGVAQRVYVIPSTLGTGAKPLQANFAGDTLHNASAGSSTLTVNP